MFFLIAARGAGRVGKFCWFFWIFFFLNTWFSATRVAAQPSMSTRQKKPRTCSSFVVWDTCKRCALYFRRGRRLRGRVRSSSRAGRSHRHARRRSRLSLLLLRRIVVVPGVGVLPAGLSIRSSDISRRRLNSSVSKAPITTPIEIYNCPYEASSKRICFSLTPLEWSE